jgi:hypothetical protein
MNQETVEEPIARTADQMKEESKLAQSLEDSKRTERTTSTVDLLNLVIENSQKQDYAKQIVEAELARDSFDQDWRLAKVFALSGAFADIKGTTPNAAIATAMAKIQLGRSWGIVAADAMQFIYFNNGRPSVQNELIAAKLQDAGWNWILEWQRDGVWGKQQGVVTGCRLWPMRNGSPVTNNKGEASSIEFTKTEAERATIWEKGKQIRLSEKWNYQSWPEDMYFSKCIARLKRRYAPNVLRGAVSQEEAEDYTDAAPETAPPPARVGNAPQAQAATEEKTAKLAEKLKKQAAPKEEPKQEAPAPGPVSVPAALGKKDGLTIYEDFPVKETVPNRQKFFVRQNGEDKRYYWEPDENKFMPAPELYPKRAVEQPHGDMF